MPLNTDIDRLALGDVSFAGRHYVFLVDTASGRFVAAARYEVHPRYLECVNLVSEGYGPTMFMLLMQKARRDGMLGVAPDLLYNSDEAKRMDARFYSDALPGVCHVPNEDARHAEVYLNQIYFLTEDVVDESKARGNAERYFAGSLGAGAEREALSAFVGRLETYLFKSELPFK
jgi:hypothetical protein